MKNDNLVKLYRSHKASCCKCGCTLEDNTGLGLGAIFALDRAGNFYCMNCDSDFEDGDNRIFDYEEEN